MIIYIARHGQTDINTEHRAQGRKNGKPLNTIGVEQAMELGKRFKEENLSLRQSLSFLKDKFLKVIS